MQVVLLASEPEKEGDVGLWPHVDDPRRALTEDSTQLSRSIAKEAQTSCFSREHSDGSQPAPCDAFAEVGAERLVLEVASVLEASMAWTATRQEM